VEAWVSNGRFRYDSNNITSDYVLILNIKYAAVVLAGLVELFSLYLMEAKMLVNACSLQIMVMNRITDCYFLELAYEYYQRKKLTL
jgi:hypothetical protein